MLTEWLMILLGVVLTAGTAVFVAAEFSLVAMDPATVDRRVAAGDRRAVGIQRALKNLSTELSGAQVGITLTTVLLGYTAQSALVTLLTGPLGSAGLATAAAGATAVVLSLALVNGFSMLFGELVPKNMALADPFATAGVVAPLQRGFTRLLRPVISVLNGHANAILRRFGVEPAEELAGGRSASELAALVRRSAEQGTLDIGTATLLTRSIGIGALTAVDVMTDRVRMTALPRTATAADVVAAARTTGHSRFPVVGDDHDDVVGLVNLRRAIAVPYERRAEVPVTSTSLMIPAPRVPETLGLAALLVSLRDGGMQMAVVVDEYGGTSGIVTLEDAVEEIVGEVSDEHDRRRTGAHAASDGSWVVPGVMRPDELAHVADIVVPDDGPYETLGGLVMTRLGRIARVGDEVELPGAVLRVEQMDGRRIEVLRVRSVEVAQ
ncbi:hemolysin family protein [uncultured Georgenia sp.]|uniref:hemolysin family protein n=1 Tax=uncultured Georgenia sp. TaxID=378209 RepID=UPI00263678CC|nr:hemolysin family protein [uncultured Georgenia sp.]